MTRFLAFIFIAFFFCGASGCTHKAPQRYASETQKIEVVLMKYIDGTSKGRLDLLNEAFHPDFNLYSRNPDDTLRVWAGQDYIGLFKQGVVNTDRIGRIIFVDQEDDVATAKVEIETPGRLFTDYFLLVKYAGDWKIIHKSYTSQAVQKNAE